MDNIIELFGTSQSAEVLEEDPALQFVRDNLIPWAQARGIDVQSQKFKLNGASIMACIQGMMLDGV